MAEETVSLKEHFEKILIEKDKAISAALASSKEAVAKAEENTKEWKQSANEWRGTMNDKDKLLATKADLVPINDLLIDLKKFRDNQEGKASQTSVLIFGAISVISLIIAIIRLFI